MIAIYDPLDFLIQGNQLFFEYMLSDNMEKVWRILMIEQSSDKRAASIILEESYRRSFSFIELSLNKMIDQNKIKIVDTRICTYEYLYPINFMFFEYIMTRFINTDKDSLRKQIEEHTRYFYNTNLQIK